MENITTISLVVGITIGLIELLKYIIGLFFNYLNKETGKGKIDNKQEVEIALIKQDLHILRTNEMVHLKKQMDDNSADHQKIFVVLAELKQMLK